MRIKFLGIIMKKISMKRNLQTCLSSWKALVKKVSSQRDLSNQESKRKIQANYKAKSITFPQKCRELV